MGNTYLAFSGYIDVRRSTTGFSFLLAGGMISWRSKKQNMEVFSTAEAEYISISAAGRESIWLRDLGKTVAMYAKGLMRKKGDNITAIGKNKESKISNASNHIAIQYHHSWEVLKNGITDVQHVPSEAKTLGRAEERTGHGIT